MELPKTSGNRAIPWKRGALVFDRIDRMQRRTMSRKCIVKRRRENQQCLVDKHMGMT